MGKKRNKPAHGQKGASNARVRGAIKRDARNEAADGSATAAQRAYIQRLDPGMPVAGLSGKDASAIITWLKELK